MTDLETAKAAPAPGDKSEGQLLFDRMLAQCNRFNRIRKRLEEVRDSIAPSKANRSVEPGNTAPAPATSFFDGLHMLADGNDLVADELEKSVEDLAALF